MYDHSADKKNENKWKKGSSLVKINLNSLPAYINKNLSKSLLLILFSLPGAQEVTIRIMNMILKKFFIFVPSPLK